ncbi:MAG: acyclic terpene utilization AtuA family protein [Acidimicrobiales bacterium]
MAVQVTVEPVRVLGFVTHAPRPDGVDALIEEAFSWGVDVVAAQGTSTDWGPYWLGSGRQIDTVTNLKENIRPYLRAAIAHRVPFVFSVGLAGADVHLDECLERVDEICSEEGWDLDIATISGEISPDFLRKSLESGTEIPAAYDDPSLAPLLSGTEVDESIRVVGLLGPEPIMDALRSGVDGVITGRALDIGLHMALPMLRGVPRHVAAHAGKVLECGGLACESGSASLPVWAELDDAGFTVRSVKTSAPATPRSIAAHGFYERSNPWFETNPGGVLDLTDVVYTEVGPGAVRCEGARWIDAPYSVLIEGAKLLGYRTTVVATASDPTFIQNVNQIVAAMHEVVEASPQLKGRKLGTDFDLQVRVFGGAQNADTPGDHEVALVVDAVATSQALSDQVAFLGYSHIHATHYPGRLATAGNLSFAYMPILQQLGEVYAFSIYHILPLEDPSAPFVTTRRRFPRTGS